MSREVLALSQDDGTKLFFLFFPESIAASADQKNSAFVARVGITEFKITGDGGARDRRPFFDSFRTRGYRFTI